MLSTSERPCERREGCKRLEFSSPRRPAACLSPDIHVTWTLQGDLVAPHGESRYELRHREATFTSPCGSTRAHGELGGSALARPGPHHRGGATKYFVSERSAHPQMGEMERTESRAPRTRSSAAVPGPEEQRDQKIRSRRRRSESDRRLDGEFAGSR